MNLKKNAEMTHTQKTHMYDSIYMQFLNLEN